MLPYEYLKLNFLKFCIQNIPGKALASYEADWTIPKSYSASLLLLCGVTVYRHTEHRNTLHHQMFLQLVTPNEQAPPRPLFRPSQAYPSFSGAQQNIQALLDLPVTQWPFQTVPSEHNAFDCAEELLCRGMQRHDRCQVKLLLLN